MTYLQLLTALEHRLGRLHVPLRPGGATVHDLFEGCALHHELVLQLVRAIYSENRCHHIRDIVTAEVSLQALIPIQARVLQSEHTDIDTYHFLQTFITTVQDIFGNPPKHRPSKVTHGQILFFPTKRVLPH